MVNISQLRKKGLTEEKLKSYFSDPKPDSSAKKLINEICDEIRDGVSRNLRDYRIYWAIDRAFDTPFYQLAYTKLKGLLGKAGSNDKSVLEQVKSWGLVHLLPNAVDEKGCLCKDKVTGEIKKSLNLPVFFDIEIPLVLAYATIRWAKLFNDRNLVPLYKYEPIKFNKKNRMRAEIVTEVMQIMTNQLDYSSVECQAILQTLIYGIAIKFPREAWYVEKQEDENGKAKIVKEGLRFNIPHPTRQYYDLYSWTSTINSNSGVKYGGYWELCRYKDILGHKEYWNKDKVSFGPIGWFKGYDDFFSTVYPCVLSWPDISSNSLSGVSVSVGALDREQEAAYYTSSEANNATLINQHFKKIIPAEHGLGSYEYPVWLRFVMGNGETVFWAEPTGYTPMAYYGYDADQNRARHSTLALEIVPFQDAVSQTMSQWRYSTAQNLINPIFVNEDVVPREVINQLENVGERLIRGKTFIPFSDTENFRTSVTVKEAFVAPQLTRHDTAQLATLIRGILDILDRVLVLSSQEIAQAAPHEQTAEEIRNIASTTSTRLDFTGSFIDRGIFATKRMLYEAWQNHGDDNVTAQISSDYAETEEEFKTILKDVGLEIDDKDDDGDSAQTQKRAVKGKKSSVALEIFSSTRDASNRIDNPGIAAAMSQIFQAVVNNPILMDKIGPEQMVDMLNDIMHTAGLPKERRFKVTPGTGMQVQQQEVQDQMVKFAEQVKQAIDQSAQQVTQAVLDETAKALQPISQAIDQLAQKDQQQDQVITALAQSMEGLKEIIASLAQPPPPPPEMMYDPNAAALPV